MRSLRLASLGIAGSVLVSLAMGAVCVGLGEVPHKVNYQGRLVDAAGVPRVGAHTLVFRMFDDYAGGAAMWSETQPVTVDSAGVFTAVLGSVTPINAPLNGPRWLEIEVDGEVLTPRRELVSVPFALQAGNSDLLEGYDAEAFPDSAHSHHSLDAAGGALIDAVYVDDTGRVGVGTGTPGAKLEVAGTALVTGLTLPTGATDGYVLTSDAAGAATWQPPQAVSDGDWVISDDDIYAAVPGKIGIGTTNPAAKVDISYTATSTDRKALQAVLTSSSAEGGIAVLGGTNSSAVASPGYGVFGVAWSSAGAGVGVGGSSQGSTGKGVEGAALHGSGVNYGVYGKTNSPNGYAGYFVGARSYFDGAVGIGVLNPEYPVDAVISSENNFARAIRGVAAGDYTTGQQVSGVYGVTESASTSNPGAGVYGWAASPVGSSSGVRGETAGQSGKGVFGWATNPSGTNYGVFGLAASPNGYAGYFDGARSYFSGKVGIGTNAPQSRLQVHEPAGSVASAVQVTNLSTGSSATDGVRLSLDPNGEAALVNLENSPLNLGTNGASKVTIYPNGKISIGEGDTLGAVTISAVNPTLAINSNAQAGHNASIAFYADGAETYHVSWHSAHGALSMGRNRPLFITSQGRLGFDGPYPGSLLDCVGDGTNLGGVNGYLEIVGHFQNEGGGHSAISVDAMSGLDPIIYLAENGTAYWDMRTDSDAAQKFELRYHGLGMKNDIWAVVDTLGRVALGATDPGSYRLYVAGDAYTTGSWNSSDRALKKNVRGIGAALSSVIALRGVSFRWNREDFPGKGLDEGTHFGLVAQEVEEVLPEIVKQGPDGYKAIAYSELIPVLIESIKELKEENDDLRGRLDALERAQTSNRGQ